MSEPLKEADDLAKNKWPITTLEQVKEVVGDAKWMHLALAKRLQEFLETWKPRKVVELGTFHGVSACYMAAIIRPWGGHITTVDLPHSARNVPNVDNLAGKLGLARNINALRPEGGAEEQLRKWLIGNPNARIDLGYVDANHTFGATAYYFYMLGRLIRPGGWLIFDDVGNKDWMEVSEVWEKVVKTDPGWHNAKEWPNWGLIQKKAA